MVISISFPNEVLIICFSGSQLPKRALNVMECEVERLLKLAQDDIIPVSYEVPRKVLFAGLSPPLDADSLILFNRRTGTLLTTCFHVRLLMYQL